MQRIKASDSVAVLPAPTGSETPGYFSNGPPGTVADDDWFNGVQEELAYLIETIGGLTLNELDLTQVGEVVRGVRAILAFSADSGITSTPDDRALIASTLSRVQNTLCAIIASSACLADGGAGSGPALVGGSTGASASGTNSFVGGSSSTTVSGDKSAALGCGTSALVSGDESGIVGSRSSTVSSFLHGFVAACLDVVVSGTRAAALASTDVTVSGTNAAAIASEGTFDVDADHSVALGAIDALFDAGESHQAAIACLDANIGAGFAAVIAAKFGQAGATTATQTLVAASEGYDATNTAAATGDNTAVIACKADVTAASNASGSESARLACGQGATSSGARHASIAADDDLNQGTETLLAAAASGDILSGAVDSALLGVDTARLTGAADRTVGLGGKNWECASADSVVGGWAASAPTYSGANQNLQFRFDLPNGNLHVTNTTVQGSPDFAECFENLELGELPVGALVSREGAKVRLAVAGDNWLRSVSANPCSIGNAAPLAWNGKMKRDEWGRVVVEPVRYCKWAEWRRKGIRWPAVEGRAAFDGTLEEAAELELAIPGDAKTYRKKLEPVAMVRWPARKVTPAYDGPLITVPIPPPAGAEFFSKILAMPKRRARVRWPEIPGLEAYHGPASDAPLDRVDWPANARTFDLPRFEMRVAWSEIPASEAYDGPLVRAPEPPKSLARPPVRYDFERIPSYTGPEADVPMTPPKDRVRWPADDALEAFEGLASQAPLDREDWPESAELFTVSQWVRDLPKTAPDFDPARPYVPRLERPEEWTVVGLVGQVPIRIAKGVEVGDFLAASEVPGVAKRAMRHRGDPKRRPEGFTSSLEVMRIDQPFDADLGYGIAWVLIGAG